MPIVHAVDISDIIGTDLHRDSAELIHERIERVPEPVSHRQVALLGDHVRTVCCHAGVESVLVLRLVKTAKVLYCVVAKHDLPPRILYVVNVGFSVILPRPSQTLRIDLIERVRPALHGRV